MRLEKLHKESRGSFLPEEQDCLLSELRGEIKTLREQVSTHLLQYFLGGGIHGTFGVSSTFSLKADINLAVAQCLPQYPHAVFPSSGHR